MLRISPPLRLFAVAETNCLKQRDTMVSSTIRSDYQVSSWKFSRRKYFLPSLRSTYGLLAALLTNASLAQTSSVTVHHSELTDLLEHINQWKTDRSFCQRSRTLGMGAWNLLAEDLREFHPTG